MSQPSYPCAVASDDMRLPRSALLALWLETLSRTPLVTAEQAITGDDEPHVIVNKTRAGTSPELSLRSLIASAQGRIRGSVALFSSLPAAITLPPEAAALADETGELTLIELDASKRGDHIGSGTFALIPVVEPFGSMWERGHHVRWHMFKTEHWQTDLTTQVGDLTAADVELTAGVHTTTRILSTLDVGRWCLSVPHEADHRWRNIDLERDLPADLPTQRIRMLNTAAQLNRLITLADAHSQPDDASYQVTHRRAALSDIANSVHFAVSAATLACVSV